MRNVCSVKGAGGKFREPVLLISIVPNVEKTSETFSKWKYVNLCKGSDW